MHSGIFKIWLLIGEMALLTDNYNRQLFIYVKCCDDWFVCLCAFLFIAFVLFLFAEFIHLFCVRLPYTMVK